ncbi:MAG: RNase adapter RapZ [Holophagaceae bacterium]|nr:RNase adapter RapZ [Holophagaceae bacterium]
MDLIVVTGLSGAGRRSVLGALEDMGCMALDNVPARLLEPLLELERKLNPGRTRLAVGMDSRHREFPEEIGPLLARLRERGLHCELLFLEASEDILLRRFSETRRPHHLAGDDGVAAGLARERVLLEPVRAEAGLVLDTSSTNLAEMRQRLRTLLPELPEGGLCLRLMSFGFKRGLPAEADVVLDARFLPNPFYVPELKPLTGQDAPVRDFLLANADFRAFLDRAEGWIRWSLPLLEQEGRAYHTVAIGCTGGQHRSVALAELLHGRLTGSVAKTSVSHRELAP